MPKERTNESTTMRINHHQQEPYAMIGKTNSDKGQSLSCLFTMNLSRKQLPEILAVDVEPNAVENVAAVINYATVCMLNSNAPMPHLSRKFLRGKKGNEASYVAFLQVTDPAQLDVLYQQIMGFGSDDKTPRPSDFDMVILAMPVVPRRGKMLWGQVPPAPENKTKIRNTVWMALESKKKLEGGFLRAELMMEDGSGTGKENSSPNSMAGNSSKNDASIGKLKDALSHPEWNVQWKDGLKPKQMRYLESHVDHFSTLAIDKISKVEASTEYVKMVCENAPKLSEMYHQGYMLGRR